MKNTHYFTFTTNNPGQTIEIPKRIWRNILNDIKELLSSENLPKGLELSLVKGKGSPFLNDNAIHFSSSNEQESPFVLKRTLNKFVTKIKTEDKLYNDIIGACLLVIKKYLPNVVISNKMGYKGWKVSLKYFEYVLQKTPPVIYAEQSTKINITFDWKKDVPTDDYEIVMKDLQSIIDGYVENLKISIQ